MNASSPSPSGKKFCRVLTLLALGLALFATPAWAAGTRTLEQGVVYGDDNRMDVYAHPDQALRQIAIRSTAALIYDSALFHTGTVVEIRSAPMGEELGMCEGEPFYSQPAAAFCSGTLIDDDLILTAGHCVSGGCGRASWVFNYYLESEGVLATITEEDVFSCAEVVVLSNPFRSQVPDYAVVRLDRPATPRHQPRPLHPADRPLSAGDPLTLIGYGSGLPAKIDSGGMVLDSGSRGSYTFAASVDAFGGHSGGGVFDADGLLVGILVGGNEDFVWDRTQGCFRVAHLPERGTRWGGEEVTYASVARSGLCQEPARSPRVCDIPECGDGVCDPGEDARSCPMDCEGFVPPTWLCAPNFYGGDDGCHCDCGAPDPDCRDLGQPVIGCDEGHFCSDAGLCVDPNAGNPPGNGDGDDCDAGDCAPAQDAGTPGDAGSDAGSNGADGSDGSGTGNDGSGEQPPFWTMPREPQGCGCRSGGSAGGAPWWLVLAPLLLWRRRR